MLLEGQVLYSGKKDGDKIALESRENQADPDNHALSFSSGEIVGSKQSNHLWPTDTYSHILYSIFNSTSVVLIEFNDQSVSPTSLSLGLTINSPNQPSVRFSI